MGVGSSGGESVRLISVRLLEPVGPRARANSPGGCWQAQGGPVGDRIGQRRGALSRPIRTAFDKREERETSEPLVRPSGGATWGGRMACPKAVLFQVKYTNRCPVASPGQGAGNV